MTPSPGNELLGEVVDRVLGERATRPLLTVEQAADLLGLGRTATFDAIRRGDLPHVKVGRRTFVPTPALARWLLGLDSQVEVEGSEVAR